MPAGSAKLVFRYRLAPLTGVGCLACIAVIAAGAAAAPTVHLTAAFTPDQLSARTTMEFGLRVSAPNGKIPSPATQIELAYPADLGIANSGLGLEVCPASLLMADGPTTCPVDSRIGLGSAVVEVPFSPHPVREAAHITVFSAPVQDGEMRMLFFAAAESPIIAELVLPARVVAATAPFGGILDTQLPLVPTLPEDANVAIVQIHTTIGPSHIKYVEYVNGKTVYYRPKGLRLPDRCPNGGFPFTARMAFEDGTRATASTLVPCPGTKKEARAVGGNALPNRPSRRRLLGEEHQPRSASPASLS